MDIIILLMALALIRWTNTLIYLDTIDIGACYFKCMAHLFSLFSWRCDILQLLSLNIGALFLMSLAFAMANTMIITGMAFKLLMLLYCLGPNVDSILNKSAVDKEAESLWMMANDSIFAVIFLFISFGPVVTVIYRLALAIAWVDRWRHLQAINNHWRQLLAWVPVRLLALSFAMVGNFSDTMTVWSRQVLTGGSNNSTMLIACGNAALGSAKKDSHAVLRLLKRALILWLLVITVYMVLS